MVNIDDYFDKYFNSDDMPRYYVPISLEDFRKKVEPLFKYNDDECFPYNMPRKISEDIKKINFDMENFEPCPYIDDPFSSEGFGKYPCGFHMINDDFPVLFVNAGGDWEQPICFIIYWDGKTLRGYVPEKGNVFNPITKTAFGSDEDSPKYYDGCIKDALIIKLDEIKDYIGDQYTVIFERIRYLVDTVEEMYIEAADIVDTLSNSDAIFDDIRERIIKK